MKKKSILSFRKALFFRRKIFPFIFTIATLLFYCSEEKSTDIKETFEVESDLVYYDGKSETAETTDTIFDATDNKNFEMSDENNMEIADDETGEKLPDKWSEIYLIKKFDIHDMFGTDFNKVYLIGSGGNIVFFDGTLFFPMNSGLDSNLFSIDGTSSSVFVAGENGVILKLESSTWKKIDSGTQKNFYGISLFSDSGFYAVGEDGLIVKYKNGELIKEKDDAGFNLRAVYAPDEESPIAVMDGGAILKKVGDKWAKQVITATSINLMDASGTDKKNIFVVGTQGKIFYYNGSIWKTMLSNDNYSRDLLKLFVISENEGFAAGKDGVLLRFFNNKWNTVTLDGPYFKGANLSAIYIQKIDDKKFKGIVAGDDGQILVNSDGNGFFDSEINGGSSILASLAISDSKIIFAGEKGLFVIYDVEKDRAFSLNFDSEINFYSMSKHDNLVFLGSDGKIFVYDLEKNSFKDPINLPEKVKVLSLSDNFFVGEEGLMGKINSDLSINIFDSGVLVNLNGIVKDENSVFAVGEKGKIILLKDNTVSTIPSGTYNSLYGITKFNGKFFVVGEGGVVLSGDETGFNKIHSSPGNYFYTVIGVPEKGLYIAGFGGKILFYNGTDFKDLNCPKSAIFYSLSYLKSKGALFVSGVSRIVLKYQE